MNISRFVFLLVLGWGAPALAESFLTAQSFPKTEKDLSFTEKMELKYDDYEMYMPVYDQNTGACVAYCPYPGLTIEQELEKIYENTRDLIIDVMNYENNNDAPAAVDAQNISVDTKNIIAAVIETNYTCPGRNESIPLQRKKPIGEPLAGRPRISSSFSASRTVKGKTSPHYAIDFGVPLGTTVYSPADGVVARIINNERCGLGLAIRHLYGIQTIYCHLSKILLPQNATVGAGCPIAQSGQSGNVTGPHLHYAIWDSQNRPLYTPAYVGRNN